MEILQPFTKPVHFQDVSASVALVCCLGLSTLFVILLNLVSRKERDHSETIIRRLIVAVVVMPIASVAVLCLLASYGNSDNRGMMLHQWLGFRTAQVWYAVLCPVLLVTIGFSSEYLHRYLDGTRLWDLDGIVSLMGFRNLLAAPLAEEFVFRSCMLPLLLPHWPVATCVFLAPAIFGIAHLHLAWEGYRNREPVPQLIAVALLRLCYTTLFGAFSAFLFLRTGHFLASTVSHAYCNYLGLPNFSEIPSHPYRSGKLADTAAFATTVPVKSEVFCNGNWWSVQFNSALGYHLSGNKSTFFFVCLLFLFPAVLIIGHVVAMLSFFSLLAPLTNVFFTGSQFAHFFTTDTIQ